MGHQNYNLFFTSLLSLILLGCQELIDKPTPTDEETVSVYFIYNLPTDNGSSMTKATNAEVFDEFYQKIVSAELVAPTYELVLTETTTGGRYEFSGSWKSHDMVTLRTGTYHIVGASIASGDNIQDKCSFVFDETVVITASSSSITLNAIYDCFLLIFSAKDIESISNFNGETSTPLHSFDNYKYAFVNSVLYKEGKQNEAYLLGTNTDGAEFKCYTGSLYFEKGKFYVYNSVTGGFTVPKMEEGEAEGQPDGYVRVDYIEIQSTYFKSGVLHGAGPKVFVDFELISLHEDTNNYLFGVMAPYYWSNGSIALNAHESRKHFSYYIGGAYQDYVEEYRLGDRYNISLDKYSCDIVNISKTTHSTYAISSETTSAPNDYSIGAHYNGVSHGVDPVLSFKLFEIVFYEFGEEVAHFLPYKDTSTGYGVLFDTVSRKYLYAETPSSVIPGPEI